MRESGSQRPRCGNRAQESRSPHDLAVSDTVDSGRPWDGTCGPAATVRRCPTPQAAGASGARSNLFVVNEIAPVSLQHHPLAEALGFLLRALRPARNANALRITCGGACALTAGHRAKSVVGPVEAPPSRADAGTLHREVHCPRGKGGEAEAWINRIVVPAASFASR